MSTSPSIPHDFLKKLAPGYREFVEANPSRLPSLHGAPWSPAFRQPLPGGPPDMGAEPPIPVGSQSTIDLGNFSLQVMVPDGEKPAAGWPAVLFIHGGGWVFGDAAMDNGLLSRMCMGAKCVVVSVEYRLAPEHVYPAALNDSWESLLWLYRNGAEHLAIDPTRIALMGTSAGSSLAAIVAQRASLNSPRIPIKLQVLLVPVIDASFTAEDRSRWTQSMVEYEDNFSLPVLNMFWLRDKYLPDPKDRTHPEASPNYQENQVAFSGMPSTLIAVAELDSLRSDGELYAQKLEQYGVPVTVKVLKGITHMAVRADRVCETARVFRDELIEFVKSNL
ncbi:Alpha/Beta hydrolase protein [Rhizoctonia solani]|nr:Alpha/Beta hydrolase protein [Rhizoctonia solani]